MSKSNNIYPHFEHSLIRILLFDLLKKLNIKNRAATTIILIID